MSLFKLDNIVQTYAWGSKVAFNEMFNIPNPDNNPQAEMWMGVHPGGCSKIADTGQSLAEFINDRKEDTLGSTVTEIFGDLPFLFKVLAADIPLSIQVHPNKEKSEIGFERENQQGISLSAPNRNYKDANHKPELVYALTSYRAMNGFRPVEHVLSLFKELALSSLSRSVELLEMSPNSEGLRSFFSQIMMLKGEKKLKVLTELKSRFGFADLSNMGQEALEYSEDFSLYFPNDIGLLSPFILNTIELAPGEAMFLYAETPHAYVKGAALEVMANSDNVLRAGLTSKHIDIRELLDNVVYDSISPEKLRMKPSCNDGICEYPIPVDDFGFSIIKLGENDCGTKIVLLNGPEILFCVNGELIIQTESIELRLKKGESVFIGCDSGSYRYSGSGEFARVYC